MQASADMKRLSVDGALGDEGACVSELLPETG